MDLTFKNFIELDDGIKIENLVSKLESEENRDFEEIILKLSSLFF
jgi:hypothetical protein